MSQHETIPPDSGQILSIFHRLSKLNADELDAMDYLLAKLEAGRLKHGPLCLDTDSRDWEAEISAELADREHYRAFAAIQRKRREER